MQQNSGHLADPLSRPGCITFFFLFFLANYLAASFITTLLNTPHVWYFRRVCRPCTTSASWIIADGGLGGDEIFLASPMLGNLKRVPVTCLTLTSFGTKSKTLLHCCSPYLSPYLSSPLPPSLSFSHSPLSSLIFFFFCSFWVSMKYLQYVGRLLSLGIWKRVVKRNEGVEKAGR